MFFKIVILKNFVIITGKYLCWSFFSIKLQTWRAAALLNRDSNTGVSMWILQNFLRTAFFIKHLRWLLQNKVKTNVKSKWFIFLPDYTMLLSLLWHWIQKSAKLQRYSSRNTNKQKDEELKHRKTIGGKCRLL